MPEASTLSSLVASPLLAGPPSLDAQARRRRALARGAAFAMHAAAIGFLLTHWPADARREPPPIPVDLVVIAPPGAQAKTPPPSDRAAQAEEPSHTSLSGNDPARAAGRTAVA